MWGSVAIVPTAMQLATDGDVSGGQKAIIAGQKRARFMPSAPLWTLQAPAPEPEATVVEVLDDVCESNAGSSSRRLMRSTGVASQPKRFPTPGGGCCLATQAQPSRRCSLRLVFTSAQYFTTWTRMATAASLPLSFARVGCLIPAGATVMCYFPPA